MKKTMLIVDDNKINRQILSKLFKDTYEIIETEDGLSALKAVEKHHNDIEIILLDLFMPGMSGLDFLRVRQNLDYLKDIPVVVITSSDSVEDQMEAFNLGANDYVSKPFVPKIIFNRVSNVINATIRLERIKQNMEGFKLKSELDLMTGLLNKPTFEEYSNSFLQNHYSSMYGLIVVDIDNFKEHNDLKGHLYGDMIIKKIANCITSTFRKNDLIGRIGGDEFAILMVNVPNHEVVKFKVEKLVELIRNNQDENLDKVFVSVGYSCTNREPISYQELFKHSDSALYKAKNMGKAQAQEYNSHNMLSDKGEKSQLMLLGNKPDFSLVVSTTMNDTLSLFQLSTIDELRSLNAESLKGVKLIYLDVQEFMNQLEELQSCFSKDILKNIPIIAICEEGNMEQYRFAMQLNIVDLIAFPISPSSLKRRTLKQIM